jgi:hypothetical protein
MSLTRTLIGYIAQTSPSTLLCDGNACIVMGSRFKLKAHLAGNAQTSAVDYTLKKAWSDDILAGLRMGAAYAFDEEAYRLFYPLAQRAGLGLGPEDFSAPPPPGLPHPPIHLVRVQWFPASRR